MLVAFTFVFEKIIFGKVQSVEPSSEGLTKSQSFTNLNGHTKL